jgi:hypothetical protein
MSGVANPPAGKMSWLERGLLLAVFAVVGWVYFWTANVSGDPWRFGEEQRDYYNWLIDGWLDGQLHMKVEVPQAMLELKDPYDPRQRPPDLGLHDASFYKGKYYVYFGAAPVVLMMLPFRVLTGIDLPLAAAVLVFTYGGFLASAAMWLAVRRRYFAETNAWTSALVVFVLGLGGLGAVLLRRPHMWELPIAAGYCFAMLALGCVWRSVHANRARGAVTRAWWFAGASLCLALAIASRPTYLLAMPLLVAPLVAWWREERRLPWRMALWAAAPLMGVGSLMALHNYLRFGNPLEFGQAYQLSLDYESKVQHFSGRYLSFNTWRYFFSAAHWSSYFPFIAPAELPPKPPGFSGHDDVYGVFTNLPFAWLALAAPIALWRRNASERRALSAWLISATVLFAIMAGLLLCFFGSLARYELDFTPALMLLAGVGVLALERWLNAVAPRIARLGARALWIAAALFTIAFGALFSLQLDARLPERNPLANDAAARLLNRVPAFFERLLGVKHGPVAFTLRFRPSSAADYDILTIGDAPRADRVFVRSAGDERVQLGFVQSAGPEILSRALAVDFNRSHTLRLFLGSLYPPSTHPVFSRTPTADAKRLAQQVRIELDGEPVIEERRKFFSNGATVRAAPEVTDLRRFEVGTLSANARPDDFVRLRVTFPERPPTPREPLIGFGNASSGGVIFVHYLDDTGQIAFGSSVQGDRSPLGDAAHVDLARSHELVAEWLPAADAALRRVQLRLDGSLVWSRELRWAERGTSAVFGRNPSGESACAPRFTGEIHTTEHGADGRDPLAQGGDTLRLRLKFPADRRGAREPLLVTGYAGAGDMLLVEYVDASHVRFALDHWGAGLLESERVAVDYARPHELKIGLSSLVPPAINEPVRRERRGRVHVRLDGTEVWSRDAVLFTVETDELTVGRNSIGGTNCGPTLTSDISSVERLPRE